MMNPLRIRLIRSRSRLRSNDNPIKPFIEFNINTIEQRFKRNISDFGFYSFKKIERIISHSLIGRGASNPTVIRIRTEFNKSFRVLCQKLKDIIRIIIDNIKNPIDPFSWDPLPKKISNGTDEYFNKPFLRRFIESVFMESRFPIESTPFIKSPRITIFTTMQAAGNRIPAKISPFNICLVHCASLIRNYLMLRKVHWMSQNLMMLLYSPERSRFHSSLISEERLIGILPAPSILHLGPEMALFQALRSCPGYPSKVQRFSELIHTGPVRLTSGKFLIGPY